MEQNPSSQNQFSQPQMPEDQAQLAYEISNSSKIKIFLFTTLFLFAGLFFNFPLRDFIEQKLAMALVGLPNCPLTYKSLDVSYLLPGAELKNLSLPSQCSPLQKEMQFTEVGVHFVGPSFLPPGIRFRITAKTLTKEVKIYFSQGLFKSVLKIPETDISGPLLQEILGDNPIKGNILIEGLVELKGKNLNAVDLSLQSQNFITNPMEVQSFLLPELPFKTLSLRAKMDDGRTLQIQNFSIGDGKSPISITGKGKINLNQQVLDNSMLDINGGIAFSSTFLEQFSIIQLLLASKQQVSGRYQFTIKGALAFPQPSLL